jgi:hypothetical protein
MRLKSDRIAERIQDPSYEFYCKTGYGNLVNDAILNFKSEIILVIDDLHELDNNPWLNLA